VIEKSGWESKVTGHRVDLANHINTLVTNCKDKILAKLI